MFIQISIRKFLKPSRSFPVFSKVTRTVSSLDATKIVWFRDHALRIHDNDALTAAVKDSLVSSTDASILPIYLWTSHSEGPVDIKSGGTAKNVFVANALEGLNSALNGSLIIGNVKEESSSIKSGEEDRGANGNIINELIQICQRSGAKEVYYLKSTDENKKDNVAKELKRNGITPRPFGGSFSLIDYSEHDVPWKEIVLDHPWRSPLIPFVEYVKQVMEEGSNGAAQPSLTDESSKAPEGLHQQLKTVDDNSSATTSSFVSEPLQIRDLVDAVGITRGGTCWGASISESWPACPESAKAALDSFLSSLEAKGDGTMKRTHLASRLSPYLANGILSPKQVYNGIVKAGNDVDTDSFVRRICWRDYTYAVVVLYPGVVRGDSIREGYEILDDGVSIDGGKHEKARRLDKWKRGQCGFPLVDAGMRQLAKEGWMPQKVRLSCSAFLVEGLGVSWREGMQHFAEFLVDYDAAINSNMWMNAGCVGLDPYYVGMNYKRRMYWDNEGSYVRKWCPELANLPDSVEVDLGRTSKIVDCLYEPWASPPEILETAGVILGKTYPERICNDRQSRSKFFADVRDMRSRWPSSRTDDKKRDLVNMGAVGEVGLFTPRALQVRKHEQENK